MIRKRKRKFSFNTYFPYCVVLPRLTAQTNSDYSEDPTESFNDTKTIISTNLTATTRKQFKRLRLSIFAALIVRTQRLTTTTHRDLNLGS
jgi:hypothetical protein